MEPLESRALLCSDATLTVLHGDALEGEPFQLSLYAAVSGECLLTDYDIDWGDGSSGNYPVAEPLAHTYADDNPTETPHDDYAVSVTAHWDDSSTASDSDTITVWNSDPWGMDDEFSTTAGEAISGNLLANDTDPGGDPLTVIGLDTQLTHGLVTFAADGSFTYNPSGYFDYLTGDDVGYDLFNYYVVDDDSSNSAVPNVVIVVHACEGTSPPAVTADDAEVDEGDEVSLNVTHTGGNCHFLGTEVDWGDGTTDTFGPGVTPTHVYADDEDDGDENPTQDDYAVTVTGLWDDEQTATDSATITVHNVAPTVTIDELPEEVNENEPFTLQGTITDPGLLDTIESAILYIDLNFDGDTLDPGESDQITPITQDSPGHWHFEHTTGVVLDDGATFDSGEHVWGNETTFDTLAFNIEVLDDDSGNPASTADSILVFNAGPTIAAVPTLSFDLDANGFVTSATLSGSFSDPGTLDFHRVTATWGSAGSKEEELQLGERSFSITVPFDPALQLHEEDLYPFSATILDDDGGSDTQSSDPTIDVHACEVLVVNDDDDNDDGISDLEQSDVAGDDEPLPISVTVKAGLADITGYYVDITYTGTIALWSTRGKALEIPSGTSFPWDDVPTLYVEGLDQGNGLVMAQLRAPGGVFQKEKSASMIVTPVVLKRDGEPIPAGVQSVWVGEQMSLSVTGPLARKVAWSGVSDADTIRYWGGPNGEAPTDSFAEQYELTEADRHGIAIDFHWVTAGVHTVECRVSYVPRPGDFPVETRRKVQFNVNRPNSTLRGQTSRIYEFRTVTDQQMVEFGNSLDLFTDEALRKYGILFIPGYDNQAAPGTYKFTQLEGTLRRKTESLISEDTHERFDSGALVLDTNVFMTGFADSPGIAFGDDMTSFSRNDEFQTYLMWKSDRVGSIYVPLRMCAWSWSMIAHRDVHLVWHLDDSYFEPNPGSMDTTVYPVWKKNITNILWEADD